METILHLCDQVHILLLNVRALVLRVRAYTLRTADMNAARMIIVGAILGIVSQAALAFQETTSGGQTGAAIAPSADLNVPGAAKGSGTEIKVPGLGTIGALPKLDFGLELLYGATAQTGPRDDKQDTGAQIRGTLKYRFPN